MASKLFRIGYLIIPVLFLILCLRLQSTLQACTWITYSRGRSGENEEPNIGSPWIWICKNETCQRVDRLKNQTGLSFIACKLTCHPSSVLWPMPTGSIELSQSLVSFRPKRLRFAKISSPSKEVTELLHEAAELFSHDIQKKIPHTKTPKWCFSSLERSYHCQIHNVAIQLDVLNVEASLTLDTDESYILSFQTESTTTTIFVRAKTFFGARHALETATQLMEWDDTINAMQMLSSVKIIDKPVYPHRGLLIDTSRNYLSISVIKRIIDAMSYSKLNVFHWHLTDSHSFPFVSRREPLMAYYGAYSASQVYRPEEIEALVHYATIRGVKIVPELDAPAHSGNGWQWGMNSGLGKLALCINQEPWISYCMEPPCGQLNPINDNVYKVLGNIYKDMVQLFPSDIFHMGGDEVKKSCWYQDPDIKQWLQNNVTHVDNYEEEEEEGYLKLWKYFQKKALDKLDEASPEKKRVVLWTSDLTSQESVDSYLSPDRYIIQVWTSSDDPHIAHLYKKGYQLIFSNADALYLDCGFGSWIDNHDNNWCSPYKAWQTIYESKPHSIITDFDQPHHPEQILGSEACLWSEQTDETSVESRLWPRGAALAERLWTNPATGWKDAQSRMVYHRQRLVQRGIDADALKPEWCYQNEAMCSIKIL